MNRMQSAVTGSLDRPLVGYAAAAALAGAALALRLFADRYLVGVQFITFFPAVLISAGLFGWRPGLLTALLCGIAGWYVLIPPVYSFQIEQPSQAITLATYFVVAFAMAILVGRARNASLRRSIAESALRDERDRTHRALASISEGFVLLDRDFRVVQINAEGLRLEKRAASEIVGKTHWEAWPGTEQSEIGRLYKMAMSKRVPVSLEHRYEWAAGHEAWLDMRAYPTDDGLTIVYRDISRNKLAELALRVSEAESRRSAALLEAIGASAPDLIYAKDRELRMIYANPATLSVFGKTAEEALGRTSVELAGGSSEAEMHLEHDREVIKTGRIIDLDEFFTTKDGRARVYRSTKAPLRDAEGKIIGVAGVSVDVTEQRATVEALRQSEARFRALVDAVPSMVWFAQPTGEIEYLNDRWVAFTGQSPEEALPYGWVTTLHPDDTERTARAWAEALEKEITYEAECRYRRRDGVYRWHVARAEPLRDDNGQVVRWFGTSTDIHDRKDATESLELALNAGAIVGTWVWDVPSNRLTTDERFARTFGLEPEACRAGIPLEASTASIHDDDRPRVEEATRVALAAGDSYRCEYRVRNSEGVYRWIEASGKVELAADGTPLRFPGVAVDIEVRRTAEEREQLLAREVDHRSKNLLGVVQSVVQLTRADNVGAFKMAVTGRIQALGRAHSLLAATRWEGVELTALVREELAPFVNGASDRIRISGAPLRLRPGASQALALAIHELATNAAKYGALSVGTGHVDVAWHTDGEVLRFSWAERGGPSVTLPSRKGFGSTVIRSSIERQLGGTLELDWTETGLTCRLSVPADQLSSDKHSAAAQPKQAVAIRRSSLKGRRVLVVEDDGLISLQMEEALAALGCEVLGPAATVNAALSLLRNETPEAAVLDVNLGGERSDRVAEELVGLEIPFIYCTGYADPADLVESPDGTERITKPLDAGLLAGALERLFGR